MLSLHTPGVELNITKAQVTIAFINTKDYPYHSQVPGVPPPPRDDKLNAWVKIRVRIPPSLCHTYTPPPYVAVS